LRADALSDGIQSYIASADQTPLILPALSGNWRRGFRTRHDNGL